MFSPRRAPAARCPRPVVIDLLTATALDPEAIVEGYDTTLAGQHASCVKVWQFAKPRRRATHMRTWRGVSPYSSATPVKGRPAFAELPLQQRIDTAASTPETTAITAGDHRTRTLVHIDPLCPTSSPARSWSAVSAAHQSCGVHPKGHADADLRVLIRRDVAHGQVLVHQNVLPLPSELLGEHTDGQVRQSGEPGGDDSQG
jgi:hypothetical protein